MSAIFIAVKECASGNESIGTEWVETAVFPPSATLQEVWDWQEEHARGLGRLMLTRPRDGIGEQMHKVEQIYGIDK